MLAEHDERRPSSPNRTTLEVVTHCVHCGIAVDQDLNMAPANVRRLREHILGCPPALRACQPALPIFRDDDELLKQFIVEPASEG
jgi:hypothetical protein